MFENYYCIVDKYGVGVLLNKDDYPVVSYETKEQAQSECDRICGRNNQEYKPCLIKDIKATKREIV